MALCADWRSVFDAASEGAADAGSSEVAENGRLHRDLGQRRERVRAGEEEADERRGEEESAEPDERQPGPGREPEDVGGDVEEERPDGERVPVLAGFVPLDPDFKRVTAFMLDLSDLRRAEELVAEGERRWRLLAETIPAIVFSLRPDGQLEYVNTRGEAFFGAGKAESALAGLAQSIAHGEP